MLRVAGRGETGDGRVGEGHDVVGDRVLREPRRGRVDRVEILVRDRADDRGPRRRRRLELRVARAVDRIAGALVAGGDPDHLLPHRRAPVGRDVPEQRPSGEQLERRVQHEGVGRFLTSGPRRRGPRGRRAVRR